MFESHGQSEIGFGVTRLLGFDLKPRLKRFNHTKLHLPDAELRGRIRGLVPVLSRRGPIRWELIAQQYDQLIKYATAINNRTASTEAILRRFTRAATHHTRRRWRSAVRNAPSSCAAIYGHDMSSERSTSDSTWSNPGTARARKSTTARRAISRPIGVTSRK